MSPRFRPIFGFHARYLETLEEINEEGREDYLKSGGESFVPIPCLNDRDDWAALLGEWISSAKV